MHQSRRWKGGGGFRYYRLAPSLLEKDRFGNWVIAKDYNAAMLAEAMCKLWASPTRHRPSTIGSTAFVRDRLHLRHDAEPDP